MLRARALEQALRMLIDAAVQTACKIAEDGDRRWHVVDLVCATNDAEKLLAVDPPPSGASSVDAPIYRQVYIVTHYPEGGLRGVHASQAGAEAEIAELCREYPDYTRQDFSIVCDRIRPSPPSGASPQATGGYIHHSLTDWIPTPGCDCDRCTSARKSAPKPTGGASPQAETRRDCTCLGTCRGAEGLGPRWKCALETPAPVSPVEPTPANYDDPKTWASGVLNTGQSRVEPTGASPQAETSDPQERCPYCWDAHDCPACRAACIDCGLLYSSFPIDVLLPRSQWLEIHPDENGLLCAACIVRRASLVPGCASVHAFLEIVPQARPGAADQPSTSASSALSTVDVSHGQRPTVQPAPISPVEPTPPMLECCACGHLNTPQQATRLEGEWRSSGEYVCLDSDACARRIAECSNPPVEPAPEPETCEWRWDHASEVWRSSCPTMDYGDEDAKHDTPTMGWKVCPYCTHPVRLVPSEETK